MEEIMNYLKRLLYLLIIFLGSVAQIFGGGQNRAGTAAAPELMIPVGSRYLAMGGSNVASAVGLESIFWNPAGVALSQNDADVLFSYRQYIADMNMSYVAAAGNLGFGTIGISFRDLSIGDINVTTMDDPDGNGQVFSPTYFVLGLTYSNALTDRISIGANVNLINESWDRAKASGLSFDFGVQYRDFFSVQNLAVGITVKNLGGSISYTGPGLFISANDPSSSRGVTYYQVSAAEFELPSTISIGLAYVRDLNEENKISIAGDFQNNNFTYDNYRIGAEYSFKDMIFLRGGYSYSPQSESANPDIFQNYTAGFGINFGSFSNVNISLDYAYIPVKYFDANNTFTVSMGF
jgi:Type IX secretion system protein PorV